MAPHPLGKLRYADIRIVWKNEAFDFNPWRASMAPQGVAAFVLANGSMSSQQSREGEIRRQLVEADPGLLALQPQAPREDGGGRCHRPRFR